MAVNISIHLKKQFWTRRVNPDAIERHIPLKSDYYVYPPIQEFNVEYYTQEDFMRENESSAHDINSKFMSTRPIYDSRPKLDYEGNPILDENGEPIKEWFVVGFDKVETVRYGLQQRINTSKAAYLGGNGFWINHEDKSHEDANILNSWKDTTGLDTAFQEMLNSLYKTGDAAIYLYSIGGKDIQYEVFSYIKGDILFPDFDENRNPILYRLYTLRGKNAVDIYACGYIETWIQGDNDVKEDENTLNWWQKFSGWFSKGLDWNSNVKSEDGWIRLSRKDTQISNDLNQCIYWRRDDIPSGCVNTEISKLESAASFVADGVKSTSQSILFMKATDIESLPQLDSTGKSVGVKGSIDELKAADMKYVAPPDLSNIATIDIANKKESILKSSMMVDISPEIFRSGADSSAAMKLLFTDVIIWCKNEWPNIYPQLKYLVEVFKELVAKIEGNGTIATMRTSCGCDFWIPQNDTESLQREIDQVYARVKSRRAAISDIGNSHREDYEQIQKEWIEEIEMKSYIPAEAKAETGEGGSGGGIATQIKTNDYNPKQPGVTKSAQGRSIELGM